MNTTFNNIENILDKTIQNKIKELEKIAEEKAKNKMMLIRNDIFVSYSTFIKEYLKDYFNKTYGANNYNEISLMDSLTFYKTNSLLPDFSYNTNSFLWTSEINSDINKFNENSIYESVYVGFEDDDLKEVETLDTLEDDDKLGEYEDYSSLKKSDSQNKFSYYNKTNRQGAFSNLKETYLKAHNDANNSFQQKLYKEIIPTIYKKYGIKIGK